MLLAHHGAHRRRLGAAMRWLLAAAPRRRGARRRARSGAGARAGHGRLRAQLLPGGAGGAGAALVHVRAVPHPVGLDDADAARRRFHHRQQVRLRPAAAGDQHARSSRSASRSAATWWCSAIRCDPSINYIKRLVGLPGDHVEVRDNHIYVNGQPLDVTAWPAALQRRLLRELRSSPHEHLGAHEHEAMFCPVAIDRQPVLPGCNRQRRARLRVRR